MNANADWIQFDWVERGLAGLGAAGCLVLTAVIWVSVSRQQEMWPLPALYLVEVLALSAVAMLGIFRADELGRIAAWAAVGGLVGFAFTAGFTIGFYYLPIAALLGLAALWLDRRAWRRLPLHLGIALVAAVAQAALMLGVVGLLYPSAASLGTIQVAPTPVAPPPTP